MEKITVKTSVNKPISDVWMYFTSPEHIVGWNFAADTWCCPSAKSELKRGGSFSYLMEAKDASFGFSFNGTFDQIVPNEKLFYTIEDGRKVEVYFYKTEEGKTEVVEVFEPESINPHNLQEEGWNSILQNFKKYAERQ